MTEVLSDVVRVSWAICGKGGWGVRGTLMMLRCPHSLVQSEHELNLAASKKAPGTGQSGLLRLEIRRNSQAQAG
jgi:hypothetical protein